VKDNCQAGIQDRWVNVHTVSKRNLGLISYQVVGSRLLAGQFLISIFLFQWKHSFYTRWGIQTVILLMKDFDSLESEDGAKNNIKNYLICLKCSRSVKKM